MGLNTLPVMKEHYGTPLKIRLTRIIYMVALMMVLIIGQLPRYETILKEKRKKFIRTQNQILQISQSLYLPMEELPIMHLI